MLSVQTVTLENKLSALLDSQALLASCFRKIAGLPSTLEVKSEFQESMLWWFSEVQMANTKKRSLTNELKSAHGILQRKSASLLTKLRFLNL